MRETVHDTIILEREINASITAVWNAYVDPIARAQWGVPGVIAILVAAIIGRRKVKRGEEVSTGIAHAVGGLTLINVAIAVFW